MFCSFSTTVALFLLPTSSVLAAYPGPSPFSDYEQRVRPNSITGWVDKVEFQPPFGIDSSIFHLHTDGLEVVEVSGDRLPSFSENELLPIRSLNAKLNELSRLAPYIEYENCQAEVMSEDGYSNGDQQGRAEALRAGELVSEIRHQQELFARECLSKIEGAAAPAWRHVWREFLTEKLQPLYPDKKIELVFLGGYSRDTQSRDAEGWGPNRIVHLDGERGESVKGIGKIKEEFLDVVNVWLPLHRERLQRAPLGFATRYERKIRPPIREENIVNMEVEEHFWATSRGRDRNKPFRTVFEHRFSPERLAYLPNMTINQAWVFFSMFDNGVFHAVTPDKWGGLMNSEKGLDRWSWEMRFAVVEDKSPTTTAGFLDNASTTASGSNLSSLDGDGDGDVIMGEEGCDRSMLGP